MIPKKKCPITIRFDRHDTALNPAYNQYGYRHNHTITKPSNDTTHDVAVKSLRYTTFLLPNIYQKYVVDRHATGFRLGIVANGTIFCDDYGNLILHTQEYEQQLIIDQTFFF